MQQTYEVLEHKGLDITLIRKPQKRMYLRIKEPDARVVVTAPVHMPLEKIQDFIADKYAWIVKHRAQILKAQRSITPPTPQELAHWKAVVRAQAPALIAKWEPLMGVRAGRITYRNMVSRWGSCNVKTAHITLNVQLAHVDAKAFEYVVVHELCHLLEPSHNERFHAYMKQFLPDYKERQCLLRGKIRR